MGSTGVERHLGQRGPVAEPLLHPPLGEGPAATFTTSEFLPVARVAPVGRLEPALVGEASVDQRQVGLLDGAPLELRLEIGERGLGPGHDQAARGLPVEPVDEAEPVPGGPLGPQPVQERVHHRGVGRPARRVDHHAGTLVEDEQVPVLVQHGEGEVLREHRGGLGVRDLHRDPLVAAQPHRGLARPAVHEHAPLGEEPLDPRTRERRGEARHGQVEAGSRLALTGPELVVLAQLPSASPDSGTSRVPWGEG